MEAARKTCCDCGGSNPEDARFCMHCGAATPDVCPSCATELNPAARFCHSCGARTARDDERAKNAAPTSTPRTQLESNPVATDASGSFGTRKHVTLLFADIVGSTELLGGLDPEDARGFLNETITRLREAVEKAGGTTAKVMGDGLFAIFGAPLAQEDHAFRACHTALQIQKMSGTLTAPGGQAVHFRIGLNSGTAVISVRGQGPEAEVDAIGDAVNIASHLESRAPVGSVLIGQSTRRLAGASIEANRFLPEREVDTTVYELIRCDAFRNDFSLDADPATAVFVGRHREGVFLDAVMNDLLRGQGDVVAIIGEAGSGKTRLISETLGGFVEESLSIVTAAARAVDRTEPNSLLRRLLFSIFDLGRTDRSNWCAVMRKRLSALAPNISEIAQSLQWLLIEEDGASEPNNAEEERRKALLAMKALLQAISGERPVIIAIDNFQWVDASSRDFIRKLIPVVTGAPILILMAGRDAETDLHAFARQTIHLPKLSAQDSRTLLQAILGEAALSASLHDRIFNQFEGNPRFLVEVARHIVEKAANADLTPEMILESGSIPESIADLFEERIDRLPPEARKLLELTAAFERSVSAQVAAAICRKDDDEISSLFQVLCSAGLVRETGFVPETLYAAVNPVVAEAAYRGLLRDERRALHGSICDYFQEIEKAPGRFRMIGRHAYRAGRDALAAKALLKAGRNALSRLAYSEGTDLLNAALAADARIEERDRSKDTVAIEIRLALREALFATSGFEQIERLMTDANDIAERIGDRFRARLIQRHLVGNLVAMGRLEEALPVALELVAANDRDDVGIESAEARFLLTQIHATIGNYGEALVAARDTLTSLEASKCADGVTYALARMWALWCSAELGKFEEAKDLVLECQSVISSDAPAFYRILAGIGTGLFWLRFGENALAADTLRTVLPMTDLDTTRAWFQSVASPLGLALVRTNQVDQAMPLLEAAVERSRFGDGKSHGMDVVHLAECLLAMGELDKAERNVREAIAHASRANEKGVLAYALRTLALTLQARGKRESCREALIGSANLARNQGMRPLLNEIETIQAELG